MNAPTVVALTCIALALSLEEAGAGVQVSAQIDHLVITVVDLTPNNSKPAGYEFLPIDLESRIGVASFAGRDRIATFHDRDTVAALAPRYAMDDALSIDMSQARISNDGQQDLLRASASSAIAGGLANSQVAGEYLFNLLPQTALNLTVHASLAGDSLSGDRIGGDTGFALVQMSSVSTPDVPETAQAIYLGKVWPAGKKSDSWSGTLSFTISNPTNAKRNAVAVEAFLMLEAAPAIDAIPEPSSAAVVFAGVACIGLAMRRRFRSVVRQANR